MSTAAPPKGHRPHPPDLRPLDRPVPADPAGRTRVRVAPLDPSDSRAVLAMLGRCSPMTLYRRFHGVTDGVGHATSLFLDGATSGSYLAWHGEDCVGVATLYRHDGPSGEIAVLVEDAWQGRRVGSALTLALVRRAREHGLGSLTADLLADNTFVLRKLTRIGVTESSLRSGSYAVRVALASGETS